MYNPGDLGFVSPEVEFGSRLRGDSLLTATLAHTLKSLVTTPESLATL